MPNVVGEKIVYLFLDIKQCKYAHPSNDQKLTVFGFDKSKVW
jgi:hypothetical protein